MKKKLAALLLSIGMLTEMACPIIAVPTELQTEMTTQTNNDNTDGFLVPVEQKTEVPDGYIGIYTTEDLDNVRNDLDANYILMNDIDLSAYENWVPIGLADDGNSLSSLSFRGTFDGNGFCISNLSFKHIDDDNPTAETDYIGLFYRVGGYDTYNSIIRNLYISNVYFDYDGSEKGITIGVLASGAYNNSRIYNCIVDGDIVVNMKNNKRDAYIGGVIGVGYNCSVYQCSNMVDINFSRKNNSDYSVYIGGIAGNIITWGEESVSALINECTNNGSINASAHSTTLGGIVGSSHNQNGLIYIFNCSNLADINLSYPDITTALSANRLYGNVGGIVGENIHSASGGTYIAYSFNNAEIRVEKEHLESDYECYVECGGIIGYCSYANNSSEAITSISMCYNSGDIHISGMHTMRCGGIIGYLPLHDSCNSPYADCKISYNTGNIECSEANTWSSVGSIIGEYYNKGGTISLYKCYYNDFGINGIGGEVSDTQLSDCIALSDTEMQSASSFVGFDFDTVWEIGVTEGYPYPTLRDNPHRGSYHPAPRLTVTPGTTAVQTQFMFDKSLCTDATAFSLEVYDVNIGAGSLVRVVATNSDVVTMPQSAGTYSACLYAIYGDGTKVASNEVIYTVADDEKVQKPILSGFKGGLYTIALGDTLTLDGTLTAAGEGKLNVVTLMHNETGTTFPQRRIELSGSANTFNLADFGALTTDEYPLNTIGVHEFIIYASADNYTVTNNAITSFAVQVVENAEKSSGTVVCNNPVDYAGNYRSFTATFSAMPASAYLQFDNQHDASEWLDEDYCANNVLFRIDLNNIVENDGQFVYETEFRIHSEGLASENFMRKVRVVADYTGEKTVSEAYSFQVNPIPEDNEENTIGYEYQQTSVPDANTVKPVIKNVSNLSQSGDKRILSVLSYDCDESASPFFWWESDCGTFYKINDDFTKVGFIPCGGGTVTVHMGDGLGYVTSYELIIKN